MYCSLTKNSEFSKFETMSLTVLRRYVYEMRVFQVDTVVSVNILKDAYQVISDKFLNVMINNSLISVIFPEN